MSVQRWMHWDYNCSTMHGSQLSSVIEAVNGQSGSCYNEVWYCVLKTNGNEYMLWNRSCYLSVTFVISLCYVYLHMNEYLGVWTVTRHRSQNWKCKQTFLYMLMSCKGNVDQSRDVTSLLTENGRKGTFKGCIKVEYPTGCMWKTKNKMKWNKIIKAPQFVLGFF